MYERLTRLAPFTGVFFGALIVAAIASGGETPDASAGAAKVVTYYAAHRSGVETSAVLVALGFLFLVLFAGCLRAYLRREPAAEGLAALSLAGATTMAVGAFAVTGIEYGLAHHLGDLSPSVAQSLSFLSNELFLIVIAGGLLFALPGGLAILRGAALPRWLGWVGVVLGLLFVVPPLIFPALIGTLAWVVVLSVLIFRRGEVLGSASPAPEHGARAAI